VIYELKLMLKAKSKVGPTLLLSVFGEERSVTGFKKTAG